MKIRVAEADITTLVVDAVRQWSGNFPHGVIFCCFSAPLAELYRAELDLC